MYCLKSNKTELNNKITVHILAENVFMLDESAVLYKMLTLQVLYLEQNLRLFRYFRCAA